MTDRLGALSVMFIFSTQGFPLAMRRWDKFFKRPQTKTRWLSDKWFMVQAMLPGKTRVFNGLKKLTRPLFVLPGETPTAPALCWDLFASGKHGQAFIGLMGKGYAFFADQILAIDKIKPSIGRPDC